MKIGGKQHYLWRAVDQDGEVIDVFLQVRRDGAAAKRFFTRLLKAHQCEPRKIISGGFDLVWRGPFLTDDATCPRDAYLPPGQVLAHGARAQHDRDYQVYSSA